MKKRQLAATATTGVLLTLYFNIHPAVMYRHTNPPAVALLPRQHLVIELESTPVILDASPNESNRLITSLVFTSICSTGAMMDSFDFFHLEMVSGEGFIPV